MNRIAFSLVSTRVALVALLLCFAAATPARAALLIKHEGATNPNTEGFTFFGGSGSFTNTPVAPDGSTGFNAWKIHSADGASFAFQTHTWTPSELTSISTLPRLVQMRLRVVDPNDAVDAGMLAFWSFSGKEYFVGFGSNASGEPIVGLGDNFFSYSQQYTVTGAAGQYVLYELTDYDTDGTFRLFVNRIDTGLQFSGTTSTETRAGFGDGSGSGGHNGHANWNLFLLDVPEPSAVALIGVAGMVLLWRRRRES